MINFFRIACVKNDTKKPVIVNFLDWLASHKDDLCIKTGGNVNRSDPLIESLEKNKMFDVLIKNFFKAISVHTDLK